MESPSSTTQYSIYQQINKRLTDEESFTWQERISTSTKI